MKEEETAMHVQIINFQLQNASFEQYAKMCDEVAPAIASLPGLVSKVWLASQETNTTAPTYAAPNTAQASVCHAADPHRVGAISR